MTTDIHGHTLTGATAEAAAAYEKAFEAFNLYRGDPIALVDEAIATAPDFAMAHILKAHMMVLSSEPEATSVARTIIDHVKTLRMNDRESQHVVAIEQVIAGEWTAAAITLDRHNMLWPFDLVALQAGHLIDFFRANARDMRDRIARVLSKWSSDMPGYPILLGFRSFGLEEAGDYARAEDAGRKALSLQPFDCWAHHAVAHVMEMQGRAEDGIGWMAARQPYWAEESNFFKGHNWWHKALFHLDLGQVSEVFDLYDGRIRKDRGTVALDLIDATALLWRLHLCGHDVGDRWIEVAGAWDAHADGRTYPFNDWHAAMAYLGAGRMKDVARLAREFHEARNHGGEVSTWAHVTAAPLIEGFSAFWHGDYSSAVSHLHSARFIANSFGGSHAQRDIIDWTLTEAALRGGLPEVAEAMAHERLALKPHSPINLSFLARAKSGAGPATRRAA